MSSHRTPGPPGGAYNYFLIWDDVAALESWTRAPIDLTGLTFASGTLGGTVDIDITGAITSTGNTTMGTGTRVTWGTNCYIQGSSSSTGSLVIASEEDILFYADGSEVMEYDASVGNFGIGDTSPDFRFEVNESTGTPFVASFWNGFNNTSSTGICVRLYSATPAAGADFLACYAGDTTGVGGAIDAAIRADGLGGAALYSASDRNRKSNIRPAGPGELARVLAVPLSRYTTRGRDDVLGFVAQDLLEVCPEAVSDPTARNAQTQVIEFTRKGERHRGVYAPGKHDRAIERKAITDVQVRPITEEDPEWEGYMVAREALVPMLLGAVQELAAQVEALRAQVEALTPASKPPRTGPG